MPIRLSALVAAACLVVGSGCSVFDQGGGSGGAQVLPEPPAVETAPGQVILANIAYHPVDLTENAGDEVTWTWDDNGIGHTVTADDGSFDSGRRTEGTFRRVFPEPGTYPYHCEIHASMHGTVTVR